MFFGLRFVCVFVALARSLQQLFVQTPMWRDR